ncbi:hypothetical protein CRV08_09455 [Halarcobacter ebronensis]|uniref:Uncharacterized protein n=1 Tax=Halarcobacter ebronensis TaxID=1462615 RepID=A0A4Q0YEG4_9BACT|nr:hypothetical protein [Halarcobacter ebronensis]RXJ68024.1 hypothetical protein CRV08_09455 [Halarcobacter ebronensis]
MEKVSNILKNIKFDNKRNHFNEQIKKNAIEIKEENDFFLYLNSYKLINIYIYNNINEHLDSEFNLILELKNSLTGVVFFDCKRKNILLFVEVSLSTCYDGSIYNIEDQIESKGWYRQDIKSDVVNLIKYVKMNIDFIEELTNNYSDESLRNIFYERKELSRLDNSLY